MKKIGQGLQFNVYANESRVLKTFTSPLQMKIKLLLWMPWYILRPFKLIKEVEYRLKERREIIDELKKRDINASLLSNLVIGEQIEQTRVTPLKKPLKDPEKAKELIDKYIDFIFECWKSGFSEKIYNLMLNNGINSEGNIVLMDFGELTFDKSYVKKDIITKRWRKSFNYMWGMKRKIKKYYDQQMCKRLTLSNLEKYWQDAPLIVKNL